MILATSVFNLHFGTHKTCEQINHFECKTLNSTPKENISEKSQCCSDSTNDESTNNEKDNLVSSDDCNCFHLIEHDAELFISLRNFELHSYSQINPQLIFANYDHEYQLNTTKKRLVSFKETIPIILKSESFLI